MKVLVWTMPNYGAEAWALKVEDRKKKTVSKDVVLPMNSKFDLKG